MGASGVGVHAAINYAQRRMDQTSDTEKQQKLEQLENAPVSADTFSRELSEEEEARFEKLTAAYQTEGRYPNEQLLEIKDESEVVSDRVCFLADTSTFYLPENTLSDEDMLELIDFCYLRDYSLQTADKNEAYDIRGVEEITKENALESAKTALENTFSIDTTEMEIQTDYQQGTDGNDAFSTDYFYFTNKDYSDTYSVTVDLQNGIIGSIEVAGNGESNYSDTMEMNAALYEDKYQEAERMAEGFLNHSGEWKSSKMVYAYDNNKVIKNGTVSYYFEEADGDNCIVSYSQALDRMYQIRYFTQEQLAEKAKTEEKMTEQNGITLESVEK